MIVRSCWLEDPLHIDNNMIRLVSNKTALSVNTPKINKIWELSTHVLLPYHTISVLIYVAIS